MLRHPVHAAAVAFLGAVVIFAAGAAGALPWPPVATRSLAAILVLVAVTRAGASVGMRGQRRLGPAVAGVALTAAVWFVGGAVAAGDRGLLVLGFAHLLAGWLAAAPEPDRAERERARLVLGVTASTISLLAVIHLPVGGHVPGAPALLWALVAALVLGGFHVARGGMGGLVLAALAGVVTLVVAARVLASGAPPPAEGTLLIARMAPLVALTAAAGAAAPIVSLAIRLPALWRTLAPTASPGARTALAWLTFPAVGAVAMAFLG